MKALAMVLALAGTAQAGVLQVAEHNAFEIREVDKAHTAVILAGPDVARSVEQSHAHEAEREARQQQWLKSRAKP